MYFVVDLFYLLGKYYTTSKSSHFLYSIIISTLIWISEPTLTLPNQLLLLPLLWYKQLRREGFPQAAGLSLLPGRTQWQHSSSHHAYPESDREGPALLSNVHKTLKPPFENKFFTKLQGISSYTWSCFAEAERSQSPRFLSLPSLLRWSLHFHDD